MVYESIHNLPWGGYFPVTHLRIKLARIHHRKIKPKNFSPRNPEVIPEGTKRNPLIQPRRNYPSRYRHKSAFIPHRADSFLLWVWRSVSSVKLHYEFLRCDFFRAWPVLPACRTKIRCRAGGRTARRAAYP